MTPKLPDLPLLMRDESAILDTYASSDTHPFEAAPTPLLVNPTQIGISCVMEICVVFSKSGKHELSPWNTKTEVNMCQFSAKKMPSVS